jgi:hypothetical protein
LPIPTIATVLPSSFLIGFISSPFLKKLLSNLRP